MCQEYRKFHFVLSGDSTMFFTVEKTFRQLESVKFNEMVSILLAVSEN